MYDVRFYTGDYDDRQRAANRDDAICYVEHHFNSSTSPTAGYSLCVVGSNASQTSQAWGKWYASACAKAFGTKDSGILIGGYKGRGDGNIKHTRMPAILVEPLFASNPEHAAIIRSQEGREKLAEILVASIRKFFPQGGIVAFSVGHKGRVSKPRDMGAAVVGGGAEADYAEPVLLRAASMLENATEPKEPPVANVCTCCGRPL